jgi:hypothetical protein
MIIVNDRIEFLREVKKLLRDVWAAVEIGVLDGDFSQQIYSELNPAKLFLIDPFNSGGEKYGKELSFVNTAYSSQDNYSRVKKRFETYYGVIIERKFSYDAVKEYENGLFDFIYHDASHLYADTKRDLNDWLPKLALGGLICGHDLINFDTFGVIKAVDEFCTEHGFEMIIINKNGGDYALRKKQ